MIEEGIIDHPLTHWKCGIPGGNRTRDYRSKVCRAGHYTTGTDKVAPPEGLAPTHSGFKGRRITISATGDSKLPSNCGKW